MFWHIVYYNNGDDDYSTVHCTMATRYCKSYRNSSILRIMLPTLIIKVYILYIKVYILYIYTKYIDYKVYV